MKHTFEKYCKEPEKIENYEKAKKDNFKGWECHHRLETHNSDGERRPVDITHKELKALRMYYNRPPEELIFLTLKEHSVFKKGKPKSDETRRRMAESRKGKYTGEKSSFYGRHHTEESKRRNAEAHKGKKRSEETRRKMKGNKNALGCKRSEETKKKLSEAHKGKNTWTKGMRYYNNGKINVRAKECPEGFTPGRLL